VPNELLIVAVVSPDREVQDGVAAAISGHADVEKVWSLSAYPDSEQLSQIGKATGGCVVFLDFADPVRARAIAAEIDSQYPAAATIAVHGAKRPQELLELMHLGVRAMVGVPLVASEVVQAFGRVRRKLRVLGGGSDAGSIFAFLPAKPGSGATTVAAHVAAASARLSNERTLLVDFDFRLGMTSFLFKLHGSHSVLDAISASARMEKDLWDQMVCQREMLDILGSAPNEFGGMDPERGAGALLQSAQKFYRNLFVDLPGDMREYEIETLQQAKECLLVTTSDIGTLHMAKRKSEILRRLGLHTKVSVLVNRAQGRGMIPIKDIETILQLPVRLSLPVADKEIALATQHGQVLRGKEPLAAQIERLAQMITPAGAAAKEPKARRFIDMFSITPVRDRANWGS
jgi:pilus assembly protein CpaE